MKRFLSFFTKRWLVSLIGLLAICCLIAFFGDDIQIAGKTPLESPFSRLLTIFVIVGTWGLFNFIKLQRSNRASDDLLDGISEAVEEDPATGLADEDIAELKERMERATAALKQYFGKLGRKNLYELPWYMIIGPPGIGKTTLLANSDLKFALEEIFGRADVKGVGGTRNCDWSFTDDAVFLDTAGRFVTQDSNKQLDREAWLGFLEMLRRKRPRRPINGVIAGVSLDMLVENTEHRRRELATDLRERIQEIHDELGVRLPIYFVVTKCDKLSGFTEFFADLGQDERRQVWGMTFDESLRSTDGGIPGIFQSNLQALLERLKARSLTRLNDERDTDRCTGLQGFPWQVQSVGPAIAEFLGETFASSRFDKFAPMLRGVYLTSATQDGTQIDALLSSVARSFGVDQGAVVKAGTGGEGRSYFINDLLRRVVFPEAELAGVNRRVEIRRALVQKSAYVATIGGAVLAAAAWWVSYRSNASYVEDVSAQFTAYQGVAAKFDANGITLNSVLPRLDAARKLWEAAGKYGQDGPPLKMRMLLYQGSELGDAAREAYQRELNSLLTPLVLQDLALQLQESEATLGTRYDALKEYLSLTRPNALGALKEPLADKLEERWLAQVGNDTQQLHKLSQHLNSLLEGRVQVAALDNDLVASMQESLRDAGEHNLLLAWLVADLEKQSAGRGFLLHRDVPNADKVFANTRETPLAQPLPKAYTRSGFGLALVQLSSVRSRLERESWVLGVADGYNSTELELFQDDTWAAYVQQYIETWQTLLARLDLRPAESREEALELLDKTMGSNSPLRGVLTKVATETGLGGVVELPGNFDPSEPIQRTFRDIALLVERRESGTSDYDNVESRIEQLYQHLDSLGTDTTVLPGVFSSVSANARSQPQPVRRWLLQLASSAQPISTAHVRATEVSRAWEKAEDVRRRLNSNWQAEVLDVCTDTIAAGYPFEETSPDDVPLGDFGRLFARDGLLDEFYKKHLSEFVDASDGHLKWREFEGVKLNIPDSSLEPFAAAVRIRRAFFPKSTQSPSVEFTLKPDFLVPQVNGRSITSFSLEVDGNPPVRYDNGPRFERTIVWPGGRDSSRPGRVLISFAERGGPGTRWSIDGPWAWLRSLDPANVDPVRKNEYIATFARGDYLARYEISTKSSNNPLNVRAELQSFRCVNRF